MHGLLSKLKGPDDRIVLYLGDGYEELLRAMHGDDDGAGAGDSPCRRSTLHTNKVKDGSHELSLWHLPSGDKSLAL